MKAVLPEKGAVLFETCALLLFAVTLLCLAHLRILRKERTQMTVLQESRTPYDGRKLWNDMSNYSKFLRSNP